MMTRNSDRLVKGPLFVLSYGDSPLTGEFEYLGQRIETPAQALVSAEIDELQINLHWTTQLSAKDALESLVTAEPASFSYLEDDAWVEAKHLPDCLPESVRAWQAYFTNGSSLGWSETTNDERVEAAELSFIMSAGSTEEFDVKMLLELTGEKDIPTRTPEILRIVGLGL